MRSLLLVLAATGCTTEPVVETATLRVSWSLIDSDTRAPVTCADYRVTEVVAYLRPSVAQFSAPCEAGAMELTDLPLGKYSVYLNPLGALGEVAGLHDASVTGTLELPDELVTAESQALDVWPPTAEAHVQVLLRQNGNLLTCASVGARGLRVTITPEGSSPFVDLYDCLDRSYTSAVPYAPFTIQADALGVSDQTIAASPVTSIPGGRNGVLATTYIDFP